MTPPSRFTELDEFYKALEALASHLESDGHFTDAQQLNTLLRTTWASGLEFLGEVMLTLSDMRGAYSPSLQSEITRCFGFARHYRRMAGTDG